jgi:hypothetical protein
MQDAGFWILLGFTLIVLVSLFVVPRLAARFIARTSPGASRRRTSLVFGAWLGIVIAILSHGMGYSLKEIPRTTLRHHLIAGTIWGFLVGLGVTWCRLAAPKVGSKTWRRRRRDRMQDPDQPTGR